MTGRFSGSGVQKPVKQKLRDAKERWHDLRASAERSVPELAARQIHECFTKNQCGRQGCTS